MAQNRHSLSELAKQFDRGAAEVPAPYHLQPETLDAWRAGYHHGLIDRDGAMKSQAWETGYAEGLEMGELAGRKTGLRAYFGQLEPEELREIVRTLYLVQENMESERDPDPRRILFLVGLGFCATSIVGLIILTAWMMWRP